MGGTLNITEAVVEIKDAQPKDAMTDKDGTNGGENSERAAMNFKRKKISEDIGRILEQVRGLQMDVDNINRTVHVLDRMSILNKAITNCTAGVHPFPDVVQETSARRKRL